MILLTGIYKARSERRQIELTEALTLNIANPHFSRIKLIVEDDGQGLPDATLRLTNDPKVVLCPFNRRATYHDYFDLANHTMEAGQICVIANSDCHFDDTLRFVNAQNIKGKFLCVARKHIQEDGTILPDPQAVCAQDAWIFENPVRVPPDCDFTFGCPGCDNKIAWLMEQQGYQIFNPAYTINVFHHHASRDVHYGTPIPGPHKLIVPSEMPT